MKVELQNGDRITIPEGCKATINGNEVVIEKEEKKEVQKFKEGDVLQSVYDGVMLIFENYSSGFTFTSHYCTSGCVNNAWNIDFFRHATDEEKQLLFDKMKEEGLRWNAEEKKVEKIRWRAEKGEYFYFVQADGCVYENTEISNEDDDKIHEYGNYFRTQEQAERAAEVVKEALEKFHEENEQMP